MIPFPAIDPVIFQIGPFALRWYALAYIAGLIIGWHYILRLANNPALWHKQPPTDKHAHAPLDNLLLWMTLGVILGGRLGYVLFYNLPYYLEHPELIFAIWRGGMSFHGGVLGVLVTIILFTRKQNISFLKLSDLVVAAAPIGLFFGRIANFINSELWGRTTTRAWGVIFPNGGPLPRHPSQLYEAALEGVVLFVLLRLLTHKYGALKRPGLCTGTFLIGYSVARIFVEQYRQPDTHIGFLIGNTTMGFWLSVPMGLVGLGFLIYTYRNRHRQTPPQI